jgi:hypothetical protein
MKKIKIIPILFVMLLIGGMTAQNSFARRPLAEKVIVKRQLVQLINTTVTSPDFLLNNEEIGGAVMVTFTVTPDDRIKIENTMGPSRRLEEYVKKKLSEITATDVIHSHNKRYSVAIRFETN